MTAAPPRPIPELIQEARAQQTAGAWAEAARLYRQVLRRRPDHAGAWLARIECTLQMGRPWRALRLCRAALPRLPGHRPALLTRQARALEARDRRDAALELLAELRAEAPDDLQAAAVQAGMLQRADRPEEADAAWRAVLEIRPDHPGAWLARIGLAQTRGAQERALELIAAAAAHCPDQVRELRLRRARALEALGRTAEALELTEALHAEAPEEAPPALLRAGLLRRTGDLAGAEAGYTQVLRRDPDHLGAWMGRIDTAQGLGDADRALALGTEALARLPGQAALIARQAGLMLHMGQPEAAIAVLMPALAEAPGDPRLRLELARAQLQAGRPEAAEALYAALLDETPDSTPARLGQAEAAEARGRPEAGLAALEGHADRAAGLGLKAAELMLQTGRRPDLAPLLDRLAGQAPALSEPELMRLFRLGEQADHAGAALAVVETVIARLRISPLIAQFLLGRARLILPAGQAEAVRDALEHRLPPSRGPEFRAFAAALIAGPEEALARARADLPGRRDTQGAALIGERLLDAGRARLAWRYLRAAAARWPNAPQLRRLFLRACIESGRLAAGHAWLDALERRFAGLDLGLDRLQLMTQQGRLQEALAGAEARAEAGLRTLAPRPFLELALALGDLEKSTALARQVQTAPGAGRQTAAHFSTTLYGAQFNELRLYAAARDHAVAAGEDPAAARARLARDFFYPAKEIVDGWADRLGPRRGAAEVPRVVFQYWNSPEPPDEVRAVMQSWQTAEGVEHRLYDRRRALAFLREAFGPRHVRAFQLANSPAEECDFLRLCLLYKHGGIYADADDKLTGEAGALIAEGPGLIVVREPWGAMANNVICAPQGHPLLLWALRTAGRSLLARENDGTWFKTGPGLLTRAVASWLEETPEAQARAGLTLLPVTRLRAHVQPHVRLSYKSGGRYWNARDAHAPQPLIAALRALGAG